MNRNYPLSAAAFEGFLCWLGPDPETAGRKYEAIRSHLIMMFQARRCVFAEDLADATFERVARKVAQLTNYTGDPARYFYGVAKRIYLEHQHEFRTACRRLEATPVMTEDDQDWDRQLRQLDEALSMISNSDRDLILRYYTGDGPTKIKERRALAEQLGIAPNALRLRVFRIRKEIKDMLRSNVNWHGGSNETH